ncbi:MAG: DUF975 family protein [Clostridia bacterium]|nr:DUF975 family protein [Clostridia bacterium]
MTCNSDARKAYKAQARADIRVKFWSTMGAVILEMVPMVLIAMIMQIGIRGLSEYPTIEELLRLYKYLGIYVIAAFLIGEPITFGAKHYFVSRARGEESSASQVLICFTSLRKYLTSLKLSLCILVRSLGWLALLYAVVFVTAIPAFLMNDSILLVVYMIVWIAILIVLTLFVVVKVRRYDGAYICMIDTPDASVWEAVKACAPIFKGHNWELLIFDLSFLLWELASVCTCGIVGIYTTAYMEIAFVHYFDDLCGKKIQQQPPEIPEL